MSEFYDGTKLLSMKDLNGNTPEIFMCTSNRSAGKTTYFNRLCVNRFLKNGEKFGVLYRYNYELADCAEQFFKDIGGLFFPEYHMEAKQKASGMYAELFLNEEPCGYALALNNADTIKRKSHYFSDIQNLVFDEFQSETNHYCDREVQKFISVHNSIARGQGKQSRYVPVFMCANPVTILNPYFVELGIADRLKEDTKFLRGNGFVLEQGYNSNASEAQKGSLFNQAFASNTYVAYSSEANYLNDSKAFIERPSGISNYLATLRYNGNEYAIREYEDLGIVYCDDRPDSTYPYKITITTSDHDVNYVMLKRNSFFLNNMRFYFEKGCFRFKNMLCKEAILKSLSY